MPICTCICIHGVGVFYVSIHDLIPTAVPDPYSKRTCVFIVGERIHELRILSKNLIVTKSLSTFSQIMYCMFLLAYSYLIW